MLCASRVVRACVVCCLFRLLPPGSLCLSCSRSRSLSPTFRHLLPLSLLLILQPRPRHASPVHACIWSRCDPLVDATCCAVLESDANSSPRQHCDVFVDVSSKTPAAVASRIAADKIHVSGVADLHFISWSCFSSGVVAGSLWYGRLALKAEQFPGMRHRHRGGPTAQSHGMNMTRLRCMIACHALFTINVVLWILLTCRCRCRFSSTSTATHRHLPVYTLCNISGSEQGFLLSGRRCSILGGARSRAGPGQSSGVESSGLIVGSGLLCSW